MGGETMAESLINSLWRTSRKSIALLEPEKSVIGILAFEVVRLMSKVVNIWHILSDKHMTRLTEEIVSSIGIQKLVSDNKDYLMDLALAEIIGNLEYVAKSMARLGKRCTDPVYHNLEGIMDEPAMLSINWFGWEYKLKKMERKVKKMERFIAATSQLHQELEVLAELEQNLRRMQANVDIKRVRWLEFQQKVVWQQQEVKNLRQMSPWMKPYDRIVRLLLRSLFTLIRRINHVYVLNHKVAVEGSDVSEHINGKVLARSRSISVLTQSSVSPVGSNISRFNSGPLGRSISNLGLTSSKNRSNGKKLHSHYQSSVFCGKYSQVKYNRFSHARPFNGCMMAGSDSSMVQSYTPASSGSMRSLLSVQKETEKVKEANAVSSSCCDIIHNKASILSFRNKLLNASTSTLGGVALALHYANIIILIEKLASSPHLISFDARDDLYNMLPTSIKAYLRAKLKIFTKKTVPSVYDAALSAEWSLALKTILEWLAPLAHNMIRWHSERNFQKQHMPSGTNVLLIQTLYFADKAKTEAAIMELLMGLNYLSKVGELTENAFLESGCNRACDDYLLHRDSISYSVID